MDFRGKIKKVGKNAANGSLWYLEEMSNTASNSKNLTEEQRASLSEFSDNIHELRNKISPRQQFEEEQINESDVYGLKTQEEIDCMTYNEKKNYYLQGLRMTSDGPLLQLYSNAKRVGNDLIIEVCEIEIKRRGI